MSTRPSDNQTLTIELLQVDMSSKGISTCSSCDIIKTKLNNAIELVKPLLSELNHQMELKETTIKTISEAQKYDFVASPTVRAGDFRYHPEHNEKLGEEKTWSWGDRSFSSPPEEALVQVILRGYLGDRMKNSYSEVTPYVKQFLTMQSAADVACSCS